MRIPWYGGNRAVSAVVGLVVLLGLAALTGCGDASKAGPAGSPTAAADADKDEPAEDAIAIKVDNVSLGSLSSLYSTSATLRADKRATVTARTKGVVRELLVEEGDWVDEGQKLAVLENDEQTIAFEQAQANYENKRREHERSKKLHAQELLSDEEYDIAAREAVDAKHSAELAELELSRTVIRATFAGRVLARHLDPGATVNDGTPVYDIADLEPLYADVQVPERQVGRLKAGQQVRLMTDENATTGVAQIERIAPQVDPTTGTVKVTLAVARAEGLRPGSFVRVGIVTDTHADTLVVPRSALVAEGRRWHLFRLKDGDAAKVELIEVTRGFEEADRVEILADSSALRPLRQGDPIVVTGASSLSDDSHVEVLTETAGDAGEDPDETEEKGGSEA